MRAKTWNQIWTDEKWQRAQALRTAGKRDDEIGAALGLTETQVGYKFNNELYAQRAARDKKRIEAEMDKRDALLAIPQSLTAAICGDPLPGRSALDKARGAHR